MAIRYLLLADIDLGTEDGDALRLSVSLPSALVGVPYTGSLIAGGGLPPYTYDDTPAGTLPPGLVIDDTTGAVTGTPSAVGYYEFTAAVTDANADTASQVVSIRVLSGIAFTGSFPIGEVGIAYSGGLSAAGGTPPYTWTVPSGTLPTSLTIDSGTGIVSGTPSADGTFNFTVRATDSLGNPQDFPTSITIAEALDITTSFYPDGFVGTFYNAGPTVIGGVAPISYTVSSGTIPAGTNFSPATGFVSGTPTTVANHTFDITGTDALGGVSTVSLAVSITNGGGGGGGTAGPYITGIAGAGTEGTPYTFTPTLHNDGGATSVLWETIEGTTPASNIPFPGVSTDPATGEVTGTPTVGGVYGFELCATPQDGTNLGATSFTRQTVTIASLIPTDPFWTDVILLFPFNEADGTGGTSLVEVKGHTYTNNNSLQTTNAEAPFDTTSADCPDSPYLTMDSSADFTIGTDDFTIDAYIYIKSGGSGARFLMGLANGFGIYYNANRILVWNGSSNILDCTGWNEDQWYLLSLVRRSSGGTLEVFQDGSPVLTGSVTPQSFSGTDFTVLWNPSNIAFHKWDGYVKGFRYTRVDRYGGSPFVPPNADWPTS